MGASKESFTQMRDDEQQQAIASKSNGLTLAPKSILDLTSEGIKAKSQQIVDYYTDGFNNPAEGLILAKKLTEMAEQIKNNLQDPTTNELKLGKSEKAELFGCVITEQMVGVKYDYKPCGDPVWNELKEKITNRESFLKTIKGSKAELIEETGEVVTIYEPIKSGKMAPVIKIL